MCTFFLNIFGLVLPFSSQLQVDARSSPQKEGSVTVLLNSERKILLRKFVECLKALKCTQASNGWTNGQFADLNIFFCTRCRLYMIIQELFFEGPTAMFGFLQALGWKCSGDQVDLTLNWTRSEKNAKNGD